MRNHSAHIADYCPASCPNPSGGTTEFMESMTFWLNFLSATIVVVAVLVAIVSIVVGAFAIIGFEGVKKSAENIATNIADKTAERVAKEIMFGEKFIQQVVARQFRNESMSGGQLQNRNER